MRRTAFCIAIVLVSLTASPSASAEPKEQEANYLPSPVVFTIACSAEEHPLVPQGLPEDSDDLIGWAVSGEPECAFSDALNIVQEAKSEERRPWGMGGAWHEYGGEDVDTLATAWATDAVFGADAGYLTVRAEGEYGSVSSEGCGIQSIVLPDHLSHPQAYPEPYHLWWAFIKEVGVDEDLTVCMATTGTLHATWGA